LTKRGSANIEFLSNEVTIYSKAGWRIGDLVHESPKSKVERELPLRTIRKFDRDYYEAQIEDMNIKVAFVALHNTEGKKKKEVLYKIAIDQQKTNTEDFNKAFRKSIDPKDILYQQVVLKVDKDKSITVSCFPVSVDDLNGIIHVPDLPEYPPAIRVVYPLEDDWDYFHKIKNALRKVGITRVEVSQTKENTQDKKKKKVSEENLVSIKAKMNRYNTNCRRILR